jgi:hypothetical protein
VDESIDGISTSPLAQEMRSAKFQQDDLVLDPNEGKPLVE